MVIKSFIKDYYGLRPIDVEIECINGLQQITILGLPDKIIQESAKKIQSALLNQGYHMPRGQQIIVSLSPRDIRKSSLGVELAIALGILWISGQKKKPTEEDIPLYVYGELSLSGAVIPPDDMEDIPSEHFTLVTGYRKGRSSQPTYSLDQLQSEFSYSEASAPETSVFQRPQCKVQDFPEDVARLLQIVAVGEHHALLAGSAGSGKTTFAEAVVCFLKNPEFKISREYRRIGRQFGDAWAWRPLVQPHHTSTPLAMIGGGSPVRPGEISRAHGGVLIVDELSEFHQDVQAALREPMEQGVVRVARSAQRRLLPAQAIVIGTTNLCKCGEFTPGQLKRCRCSSQNLRRYLERLSGPFIDRFPVMALTHEWSKTKERKVTRQEILEKCQATIEYVERTREQKGPNQSLTELEIIESFSDKHLLRILPEFHSQRRRLALLRVARTVADIENSHQIEAQHIRQAEKWTVAPFVKMRALF